MSVPEFKDLANTTKFVMIGNDRCPFCRKAEQLLRQQPCPYEKIDSDVEREVIDYSKRKNDYKFIPQIYVCGNFIGGLQELQNYLNSKKDANVTAGGCVSTQIGCAETVDKCSNKIGC
ncbi:Glutaredoxin-C2 [Dictyocoela muelleri]|nr:Glutaredoxin-C2 [Dictyocoela muelleri]